MATATWAGLSLNKTTAGMDLGVVGFDLLNFPLHIFRLAITLDAYLEEIALHQWLSQNILVHT